MSKNRKIFLYTRQKLLLALLQVFGGNLERVDMQKYLFLFIQNYQDNKSYEFVPYKFGCFSFQSYADRRKLIEFGIIADSKNWCIVDNNAIDYLDNLDAQTREQLIQFKKHYSKIRGKQLIRNVYRDYPYYAVKSKILERLEMDSSDLKKIEKEKPKQCGFAFFTIGYEGKSFEYYLNQLIKNNVRILCDVRKNPISRKYGFSKTTLSKTLNELGVEYVHIPELGIVSEKRQELNSQTDYEQLFFDYEQSILRQNKYAVNKLYNLFKKEKRLAITCFEASHSMCHRGRVAEVMGRHPGWKYEITHL